MIYYSHDHTPTQEEIKLEKLCYLRKVKLKLLYRIANLTRELNETERKIEELER